MVKLSLIPGLWLLLSGMLPAQQMFELASIKPADPDQAMSIARSGNRLTFSNYSVEMLILWAYDIRSERLWASPKDWIRPGMTLSRLLRRDPLCPGGSIL